MEQSPPPLVAEVDDFLERNRIPETTFGRLVMKDPHFVRDLRAGRDLKMSTVERVRTFMAEYVPLAVEDAA